MVQLFDIAHWDPFLSYTPLSNSAHYVSSPQHIVRSLLGFLGLLQLCVTGLVTRRLKSHISSRARSINGSRAPRDYYIRSRALKIFSFTSDKEPRHYGMDLLHRNEFLHRLLQRPHSNLFGRHISTISFNFICSPTIKRSFKFRDNRLFNTQTNVVPAESTGFPPSKAWARIATRICHYCLLVSFQLPFYYAARRRAITLSSLRHTLSW